MNPLPFLFCPGSLRGDSILDSVILQLLQEHLSLLRNAGDRKLYVTNSYNEKAVPTVTGDPLAEDRGTH